MTKIITYMKCMFLPRIKRMVRPSGVIKLAAYIVGFLPHISIALVRSMLPIEKLMKLTLPIKPIMYGSSHTKSRFATQFLIVFLFSQSISYLETNTFLVYVSLLHANF